MATFKFKGGLFYILNAVNKRLYSFGRFNQTYHWKRTGLYVSRGSPLFISNMNNKMLTTSNNTDILQSLKDIQDKDKQNVSQIGKNAMDSKYEQILPNLGNKTRVFVCAKNLNYDKEHLRKLFSKFGSVHSILVPKKKVYNNSNSQNAIRYAFVFFLHEESAEAAIAVGSIEDDDVVIKIRDANSEPEINRTVMIHELPATMRVRDVLNHFNAFGKVEFINFVFNATVTTGEIKNFALVIFKKKEEAEYVVSDVIHMIDSIRYPVTAATKEGRQRKDRCRKILVQDIPESKCDEGFLNEIFSKVGDLQKVYILRDKATNKPVGTALVEFLSQDCALKAEDLPYEIDGQKLLVRALGWSIMDLGRNLYDYKTDNMQK